MKPADILFSAGNGSSGHVMMVVEDAVVVKKNGEIDGEESYVYIQDQRGGARSTSSDYTVTEDGEEHIYSGRTHAKLTFNKLFKEAYLPYTCAEFQGTKAYELPTVATDIEIHSFLDLAKATLQSNHLLCWIRAQAVDTEGNAVFERTVLTTFEDMNHLILKNYPLSDLRLNQNVINRNSDAEGDFTLVFTCLDATGTEFEFARFPITIS